METKLIKSAAFGRLIRDREPKNNLGDPAGYFDLRDGYDYFLDELLELKRFIPCGKDGNPIELLPVCADGGECVDDCDNGCLVDVEYWGNYRQWQKALKDVWFEGFEFRELDHYYYVEGDKYRTVAINKKDGMFILNGRLAERLESIVPLNLNLTNHKAKSLGIIE